MKKQSNLKLLEESILLNKFIVSKIHQTSSQNIYLIHEDLNIFRKKQELLRAKRAYLGNMANLYEAEVIYRENNLSKSIDTEKEQNSSEVLNSTNSQANRESLLNYRTNSNKLFSNTNSFSYQTQEPNNSSPLPSKNNDLIQQTPNSSQSIKIKSFYSPSKDDSFFDQDDNFQSHFFTKSFKVSRSPLKPREDSNFQPNISFHYSSRL